MTFAESPRRKAVPMERPSLPSLLISIAILMAASKIFSLTPVPFSSSLISDSFFFFFFRLNSPGFYNQIAAYFFFNLCNTIIIITDKAPDDTYFIEII